MAYFFAIFFLAIVVASVPFMISFGTAYLQNPSGWVSFVYSFGDLSFVGISLALATVLLSAEMEGGPGGHGRQGIATLTVLTGTFGLITLVAYAVYTINRQQILKTPEQFVELLQYMAAPIGVTLLFSFTTHFMIKIPRR